jgi:hypothetical protein
VGIIYYHQIVTFFYRFGKEQIYLSEPEVNSIDKIVKNDSLADILIIIMFLTEAAFYLISMFYFRYKINTYISLFLLINSSIGNTKLIISLKYKKSLHYWFSTWNKLIKVAALVYVIGICIYLLI